MNAAYSFWQRSAVEERVAIRLKEWDSLHPGKEGQAKLLCGLTLSDDGRLRSLFTALDNAGVITVTELRDGLSVETRSFIGRVAIGPLDVTIEPKIPWSQWLTLVGYALRLRGLVRTERLQIGVDGDALRDLILLELAAEARDLLARGLHRDYVRHRRSLTAPRGRVDFSRLARQGGLRDGTVPSRFTKRSHDSVLNRALLAGLVFGISETGHSTLRALLRRLTLDLEQTITATPVSSQLLRSALAALDRRTMRYSPSLQLIDLLLQGQSLSISDQAGGASIPMPGFALDMNRIWQRLLFRVLSEWNDSFEVYEEYALRNVIVANLTFRPRHKPPTPRPDFAAFRRKHFVGFLDAKYRDLWVHKLPREMLYQLSLYAMTQQGKAAVMLYPTDAAAAVEERFDIQDPATGNVRASVALRPVRLDTLERLISAGASAERIAARERFANELIIGPQVL